MSAEQMSWEHAVLWLRNQPEQAELVRACFYDDPLIEAARRYSECEEWLAVRELLPVPPGRALDVGAGRGISTFALAKEGWRVTALEPDPSPIVGAEAIRSLSRDAGFDCEVVQEYGERLPFDDASFDLVYCRQSLHHAENLARLCEELGRVLRDGGTFVATREHVISRREDLQSFLSSHPLHHLYGGENAYMLSEYVKNIEAANIRIERVLNPFQSAINLYPETLQGVKQRLASRLNWPFPAAIPDFVIAILGRFLKSPGRLYSFAGTRRLRGYANRA
jgi:SAM-dependent methyltransferase